MSQSKTTTEIKCKKGLIIGVLTMHFNLQSITLTLGMHFLRNNVILLDPFIKNLKLGKQNNSQLMSSVMK